MHPFAENDQIKNKQVYNLLSFCWFLECYHKKINGVNYLRQDHDISYEFVFYIENILTLSVDTAFLTIKKGGAWGHRPRNSAMVIEVGANNLVCRHSSYNYEKIYKTKKSKTCI